MLLRLSLLLSNQNRILRRPQLQHARLLSALALPIMAHGLNCAQTYPSVPCAIMKACCNRVLNAAEAAPAAVL